MPATTHRPKVRRPCSRSRGGLGVVSPSVEWAEVAIIFAEAGFATFREARTYLLATWRGRKVQNVHSGEHIVITRKGIDKAMSRSAERKSVVPAAHFAVAGVLPWLLETATPGPVEPDTKNRPDVLGFARYYARLDWRGQVYRVKLTVKQVQAGSGYYSHEIEEVEVLPERPAEGKSPAATGQTTISVNTSTPVSSVAAPQDAPNTATFVPGAPGTGLAGNQHTHNEEIAAFLARQDAAGGVYSADDRHYLKGYAGSGGQASKGATGPGLLYEYYTPEWLADYCWRLLLAHGYDGGAVLEPACGPGALLWGAAIHAPGARLVGFEINPVAARIAELTNPSATIYRDYFETAFLTQPGFRARVGGKKPAPGTPPTWLREYPFSAVIGNPPFGVAKNRYTPYFADTAELRQLEAFFIVRALELLRPGGLLCYVLPASFLRNADTLSAAKNRIGQLAEMVDAYRLPPLITTTQTPLDILLLRRR